MIKSLHGIRGLSALLVFVYHYLPDLPGVGSEAFPGGHAVDVFFCLSGYVLAHVYRDRLVAVPFRVREFGHFLQNRCARVVPLALITTLLYIALIVLANRVGHPMKQPPDLSPKQLIGNLLFLDRIIPSIQTILTPKWSVSCEVFAYLLLFPLFNVLHRLPALAKWLVAAGLILWQILGYAWLGAHWGPFFSRALPGFLLGYFAFVLAHHPNWDASKANASFIAGLLGFFLLPDNYQAGAALLLVSGSASPVLFGGFQTALSGRFAYWLGEISYSLYLWHVIVQAVVSPIRKAIPLVANNYWLFFALIIVPSTLLVAHFSYRFLEVPLRDRFRVGGSRSGPKGTPLPSGLAGPEPKAS